MREYDLKKALSTGSYTRNSIRPQLLVAEDGEYRQGDILDANATMEVVNNTTSNIDDKINDILGVDNGAVQELVEILSDSDTTTGILNELAKKANISDLSSVTTSGSYDDLSNKPHIPEDPVQSDWAEDDTTDQAYIKNKPNLATVATTGDYTDLSNKPTIPAALIQSDWTQDDNTLVDYIKNKPTIPAEQIQSDWNQSDTTAKDYIKNKPNIATVATTGSYNDLTDKPAIPTKVSDLTNNSDFLKNPHISNGHEYVEIAGMKWATMNIGATSTTDKGLFFAWGETDGYRYNDNSKSFSISDYKYAESGGSDYVYTKYNDTDQKTLLDLEDDPARVNWGGNWRMPTKEEFEALVLACTISIVYDTGVISREIQLTGDEIGFILTDKTDSTKTIFFPETLFKRNGNGPISYSDGVNMCSYWINKVDTSAHKATATSGDYTYTNTTWTGSFGFYHTSDFVYAGRAVRPILDEQSAPSTVAEVAITGDYNDLINKPTIPTKVSDLTNNSDFLQQPHSSNGHEYVEIAGIKWATENIGATYENDPGLYFAWGETEGYRIYADNSKNTRDFSKSEYKYAELDGSDYVYTKYNSTDGKSLLDLEDDAARANWGGNWRIPTPDEFGTLFTNCIATIVRNSSGNQIGFLFTDKTDSTKSIYFPGCRGRKDGIGWDTSGYDAMPIWTNQRLPNNNDNVAIATASYVTTNGVDTPYPNASVTTLRYSGRPVRAILDEPTPSNTASKVAVTGDYNDLVNKPIIRSESLTLNLSDQTSTITGANNSGRVEIVIYDNISLNDYTVSIDSSYKTIDGNQIVLSVPAGCYGEVCYTNIGGTIFAKGIKQLANS